MAVSKSAGVYLPLLSLSATTFEQFLALCLPWTSFWRSVNCPHPDPRACVKTCVWISLKRVCGFQQVLKWVHYQKGLKKTKQHTDSEPIAYSESGAQRLTEPAEKEAVVKGFGNYFSYFLLPFSWNFGLKHLWAELQGVLGKEGLKKKSNQGSWQIHLDWWPSESCPFHLTLHPPWQLQTLCHLEKLCY